jgi:hypothetical protein
LKLAIFYILVTNNQSSKHTKRRSQLSHIIFTRVGTYVQRGSKFCFVVVVVLLGVTVIAQNIALLANFTIIQQPSSAALLSSLARQPSSAALPNFDRISRHV